MAYVKVPAPSVVYHLTKADRLDSILDDGQIRRFGDSECWFCESLPKMKAYMEQTVMCEGKPYYAVGGQLCRYPKFVPEDYVLLKLAPCQPKDNWYRWDQEVPPGSPKELINAAKEFSALKIGYRGDLWFSTVETIDVPAFLHGEIISSGLTRNWIYCGFPILFRVDLCMRKRLRFRSIVMIALLSVLPIYAPLLHRYLWLTCGMD